MSYVPKASVLFKKVSCARASTFTTIFFAQAKALIFVSASATASLSVSQSDT